MSRCIVPTDVRNHSRKAQVKWFKQSPDKTSCHRVVRAKRFLNAPGVTHEVREEDLATFILTWVSSRTVRIVTAMMTRMMIMMMMMMMMMMLMVGAAGRRKRRRPKPNGCDSMCGQVAAHQTHNELPSNLNQTTLKDNCCGGNLMITCAAEPLCAKTRLIAQQVKSHYVP